MFPLKKILCPIDFSEAAVAAIRVANKLALNNSAELILVSIIESVPVDKESIRKKPFGFDIGNFRKNWEKSHEDRLNELIDKEISKELKVTTLIKYGEISTTIVETANENDISIIVLALHGDTKWRHYLFGSVAMKVIRHAKCPVLTLPSLH